MACLAVVLGLRFEFAMGDLTESLGENFGGFCGEFLVEGFEVVAGLDFYFGHLINGAAVEAFFHFHDADGGGLIPI